MRWAEFRSACPELARYATDWIARRHILLLGTLRADGWPRISAVECDEVGDDLCTGMIRRSVKALDLLRDPRCTVHSVPPGKDNPDGDLKLYGRAVPVEGDAKRAYEDVMRARLGWSPSGAYHCFAFDIDSAALIRFAGDSQEILHWRADGGLARRSRNDIT